MEQKDKNIVTKEEKDLVWKIWFVGYITSIFCWLGIEAIKNPFLGFLIVAALCICSYKYVIETYEIFKIQNKNKGDKNG